MPSSSGASVSDWLPRHALEQAGLSRSLFSRFRSEAVAIAIVITAAIGVIGHLRKPGGADWPSVLIAIPASVAFVITYWQWRAARHEASYEKYFDRLKEMNTQFSSYQVKQFAAVNGTQTDLEIADHLKTMFVFSEIDTIEYVLGKLKLGYVRQDLAERAIRAFIARCIENRDGFRSDVLFWVGRFDGDQKAGYERATCIIVRYIVWITSH
jgi:hypothetical protein